MTTDEFIESIIPSKWEYEYADLVKVVEAGREEFNILFAEHQKLLGELQAIGQFKNKVNNANSM
jgi:hypothetical protein